MPEKQNFLYPLFAILVFFLGLFLFAKFGPSIPFSINQVTTTKTDLFSVTGEGKASAKPDLAQITLGFTTSAPQVSQAQNQANQIINKVTTAIKAIGVGDQDIKTTSYNLRPDYDYSTPGSPRIKAYVIDVNFLVKLHQFDKLNQVIDSATANGANQIGGLSFTLDDAALEKLQNEARTQAIANAKKKAENLARASGLTLGKLINVTEGYDNYPRPMLQMAGKGDIATVPTQIEPGTSEIAVSVTLSYETR